MPIGLPAPSRYPHAAFITLKCFRLIDLEVGKLTHQDIGQMDGYRDSESLCAR